MNNTETQSQLGDARFSNSPNTNVGKMPTTYISHGGGPMPLLGQQPELATFLSKYPQSLPDSLPTAILVISAHWITSKVSVTSGSSHPLLFDYSGFPSESYQYTYPAPGSPALADQITQLLTDKDIPCAQDASRGWDHGVFVPLLLMFPEANIPVVEMSLVDTLDPLTHVNIGRALAPLREQGVLIIGSGMSFHNFDYIFTRSPEKKARGVKHSEVFDKLLTDTLTPTPTPTSSSSQSLSREEQVSVLLNWSQYPSGTEAHPLGQEEHLLPLHVAFGASIPAAAGDDDNGSDGAVNRNKHFKCGKMNYFACSSFEFT